MRMERLKQGLGGEPEGLGPQALELINGHSRRQLKEEEVYTFAVRLCDNEVDRDGERFPRESLEALAERFVGKSGLFDHSWSAKGQAARIYRAEVVDEPETVTAAGDGYCYLKGYAYMMRTPENESLICEIEGGIKKEVSVGCAVERAVCSICGQALEGCPHSKGEEYGGQLCYASLEGVTDAYEFSFVAVPAQPKAGVLKRAGAKALKQLCAGDPQCEAQLARLEKEAGLGRRYLDELRREVVRLGSLAGEELGATALQTITAKLEEGELRAMKDAFAQRAQGRYPIAPQLCYGQGERAREDARAFLI